MPGERCGRSWALLVRGQFVANGMPAAQIVADLPDLEGKDIRQLSYAAALQRHRLQLDADTIPIPGPVAYTGDQWLLAPGR